MAPAFERLRPLLVRLAAAEPVDESRDVVVMLDGATESGDRLVIDREHVRLMARARSGLVFDVYNESDDDD